MKRLRVGASVLLLAATAFAQPAGSGVIGGMVVESSSGEPVRKAVVNLIWQTAPWMATMITDVSGRFATGDLPPGRYSLQAASPSAGTAEYEGAIELAAGEKRTDIVLKLVRPATITGTVFDSDGEPLPRVMVNAGVVAYPRATRELVMNRGAVSNDRGEYKLTGMPPGRYYIHAGGGGEFGPGTAWRQQFFGGAADWKTAAPIVVKSGEVVAGIDFRLSPAALVRVNGRVTGIAEAETSGGAAPPSPASHPGVRLRFIPVPGTAPGQGFFAFAGPPEYRFQSQDLPAGRYRIYAETERDGRKLYGWQLIDVQDTSEVAVHLAPGVPLRGTVRVNGTARGGAFQTVQLLRGDNVGSMPLNAPIGPDGKFAFDDVSPGVWDILVAPTPPGGFYESMMLGEADVLTKDMEIGVDPPPALHIVVNTDGASLSGEVEGERPPGKPVVVMLAPEKSLRRVMAFYRFASPSPDGRFEMKGIRPGKYRLFAFLQAPVDVFNPDLVDAIEKLGRELEIAPGKNSANAPLVGPEQLKEEAQ